jgi:hypothetical protein
LLCSVQPTALKSVEPLKLIAPLTVLFSAKTQAGGPGTALAATDRAPTSICGTCIKLIVVVFTDAQAVTTTLPPTMVAEADAPGISFALNRASASTMRCWSVLTFVAVAAPRAAASVAVCNLFRAAPARE